MGIINCHAGKLPFYRGRNILNWVLINDEREFGITTHYVDEGIDTGDIIRQKCFSISDQDDYSTLLKIAHLECGNILNDSISDILSGSLKRLKQKNVHSLGSYCSIRISGDEILDWNQSSREVFNFVRAICFPGPVARSFKDRSEVFIYKSQYLPEASKFIGIPGTILAKDSAGLLVKTLDSFIRIIEWSSESKLRVGDRLK
jgi:methionyl-tRNA formyltransferase